MYRHLVLLAICCVFLLRGCGNNPVPPPTDNTYPVSPYIHMKPPTVWSDNSILLPERDLVYWKIYALNLDNNTSTWFSDNNEVATIEILNKGILVSEFNLNLLKPYIPLGEYMIGIRVQAIDGQQSDYADNVVLWENK